MRDETAKVAEAVAKMKLTSNKIEGMVLSFERYCHRIHPQTNIAGETP